MFSCSERKAADPNVVDATANDGIYDTIQLSKGAELYSGNCTMCHGMDLRGSEGGTPLIGERFVEKWKDQSLGALFTLTRNTMPKSNPKSLDDESYAALIAYMLNANGFPQGQTALSSEVPALENIVMGSPEMSTRKSLHFTAPAYNASAPTIEAEWLQHRGDYGSTNYSPLDQINRESVKNLKIAWRWKTDNFGPAPEYYFKVTPLMANGILYTTAGLSRTVAAIDGQTGETLWTYRYDEKQRKTSVPRQNSGRGVAYWSSPDRDKDRIIYITPGFFLIALDPNSGNRLKVLENMELWI
jgi:quinoprotein glucose dehydrogenase